MNVEIENEVGYRVKILKQIAHLVNWGIEHANDTALSASEEEIHSYIKTNQAYNAALVIIDMAYSVYHCDGNMDWSSTRRSMFNMACEIINDCDDAYMHKSELIKTYSNAMGTIKNMYEHELNLENDKHMWGDEHDACRSD